MEAKVIYNGTEFCPGHVLRLQRPHSRERIIPMLTGEDVKVDEPQAGFVVIEGPRQLGFAFTGTMDPNAFELELNGKRERVFFKTCDSTADRVVAYGIL